ncbi:MAG: hypothetical protein ACREUY_10775, partial [Burkholderiales bacterium]
MSKELACLLAFVLSAATVCAGAMYDSNRAYARESCSLIRFNNRDTALINGTAPPESGLCYRLDTVQGQRITLKVLRGDNTV